MKLLKTKFTLLIAVLVLMPMLSFGQDVGWDEKIDQAFQPVFQIFSLL